MGMLIVAEKVFKNPTEMFRKAPGADRQGRIVKMQSHNFELERRPQAVPPKICQ